MGSVMASISPITPSRSRVPLAERIAYRLWEHDKKHHNAPDWDVEVAAEYLARAQAIIGLL